MKNTNFKSTHKRNKERHLQQYTGSASQLLQLCSVPTHLFLLRVTWIQQRSHTWWLISVVGYRQSAPLSLGRKTFLSCTIHIS